MTESLNPIQPPPFSKRGYKKYFNEVTNLKYDDDFGSLLYEKVIVFIEYQQFLPHR